MNNKSRLQNINIAIIGSGPRGLSVIERIIHHAKNTAGITINISLFDKKDHGPGCHNTDQSPYLLLNTAADQITIFPKSDNLDAPKPSHTITFDEWISECTSKGLYTNLITLNDGLPADTYQPRALFGHYLKDMLERLMQTKSDYTKITLVNATVQDVSRSGDETWELNTNLGTYSGIDFIYICTGHHLVTEENTPNDFSYISNPYPVAEKMSHITESNTVALRGLGLTAIDIIAQLTQGRGGTFYSDPDSLKLHYKPSGREPKILAFSRSGIPLLSRPRNQKSSIEQRLGKHFTKAAVDKLKTIGKVDFKTHLLPLIVKDMEEAYNAAFCLESGINNDITVPLNWEQNTPEEHWFFKKNARHKETGETSQHFKSFLTSYLADDLAESDKGNISSPIKAAYDVLRDHRELIAYAMDFGGLDGKSQKWFYDEFLPMMKLFSVGPPKQRIEQLMALVESGILVMDFGANTRCVKSDKGWKVISGISADYTRDADYLIHGILPVDGPGNDPLLKKLVEKGIVRYFENSEFKSNGLDINRSLNVLDHEGKAINSIWALGVVTEGARFYTFFLPRPYARSRFEEDAETAVSAMFNRVLTNHELQVEAEVRS